jgi:uncharacterized protein
MLITRGVVINIAVALALFVAFVKYLEAHSVFFPQRFMDATPQAAGLAFEDVYFSTSPGIRLNAWFIPATESRSTVLFFHGNAGNIGHRLEKLKILHELGVSVLILDYRGYGKSQGKPSEAGLYADAQAAYDYLLTVRNIPAKNIVLFGESLGGAVAVELAARVPVAAIITEMTFSTIRDVGRHYYPFVPAWLLADRFNSLVKIGRVKVPKLFIVSKVDEVIPYALEEKLFKQAIEPKRLVVLNGSHNEGFMECRREYVLALKEFLSTIQ